MTADNSANYDTLDSFMAPWLISYKSLVSANAEIHSILV